MNRNLFFGMLLILILLPTFASAEIIINKYTSDFSLTTPNNEQFKLCSCEARADTVVVQNTGQFPEDFHLAASFNYPLSQTDFSLQPGQFKQVTIYIENTCNAGGTFDYIVTAENNYGRKREIARTIRIDDCQTVKLDVAPVNQTIGLCQAANVQVNLTNVGTYADIYTLNFGQYDQNAQLPNKAVYLTAGQSYSQNVTFPFACTTYGQFDIPITATSNKSISQDHAEADVTVRNEYDYALDVPTSVNVCAQAKTSVQLGLENLAPAQDTINLGMSGTGANIASDLAPHIDLSPGEKRNLTLTLTPATPGTQVLSLQTSDAYGNIKKDRDITVVAENCYDATVEFRINQTTIAPNPMQTCCGEKTYYVNVRNNGVRRQTFQLEINGPSFLRLDQTTIQLDPQQNINIPVDAQLPCSDEVYDASVSVWPVEQPNLAITIPFSIDSQTQRTCHMVQIDHDELTFKENQESIPVTVMHTGSEAGNYSISTNSTLFSIQESSISLSPGEQAQLHLLPKVNLSEQEKGRYVVLPSFTLTSLGIVYNEEVGVDLQGKDFGTVFGELLASLGNLSACFWIILILFIILIVAVIILIMIYAGKPIFKEGIAKRTLFLLKTGVLILTLILLVLIIFVQKPPAEARYERTAQGNATVIEWYQDTTTTVDMQQYFFDPDFDSITYSVSQPTNIQAKVDGTKLTLTPDHGFSGINTMFITASDSKGASTTSPPFTLSVISEKNLSFTQCLDAWCHQIILLELILLMLVIFLMLLTIKEYRPKPYLGNVLVVVNKKAKKRVTKTTKTTKTVKRTSKRTAKTLSKTARTKRRSKRTIVVSKIPVKRGAQTRAVATVRGQQVVMPKQTVVREFKGSGQTVNIAVGTPTTAATPIVTVPGVRQAEIIYVGSKGGDKVHTPYCMIARRIPKAKRIAFSSKREALNAGLIPCKACRPFEGGM